ncbi:MAG: hypothetical protein QXQ39_00585 [Conexivisphaerales archaeon]
MKKAVFLQDFNRLKPSIKIRHKQKNFVKTKIEQMFGNITNLAEVYNTDISIEKLQKFNQKGRAL